MKTLILAEKPSVAKDFSNAIGKLKMHNGYYEGNDYVVTFCIGHLIQLSKPEMYHDKYKKWNIDDLPIIPGTSKYEPNPYTIKQLNIVSEHLKRSDIDKIIVATDAGREGELIARLIFNYIGFKEYSKVYRFWVSQSLTKDVIREGLSNIKPISHYDNLYLNGLNRSKSDWLIGMNFSRLFSIILGSKTVFSTGRVQTAVLSILVERYNNIVKFKPETYFEIEAKLFKKMDFRAKYIKAEDKKIHKKEIVDKIINDLKTSDTAIVETIETEKKYEKQPLLLSLTNLQKDANNTYGYSASKTLEIAQSLYEKHKCLSYPRTPSSVLGESNVELVKSIVNELTKSYKNYFIKHCPDLISVSNKRLFNDKKLEDHHALIPLYPLPEGATKEEENIYMLVLTRFAAALHSDYIYSQTKVYFNVGEHKFISTGKVDIHKGWNEFYTKEDKKDEIKLPELQEGDSVNIKEITSLEKQTKPPKYFNEATLLGVMDKPNKLVSEEEYKDIFKNPEIGLGTPATRAEIIETLLKREYIFRKKKNLIPTEKGIYFINVLKQHEIVKPITSAGETARWEISLKKNPEKFLGELTSFVKDSVEYFKTNNVTEFVMEQQDIGICPKCGKKCFENKKSYYCENYKNCGFAIWKVIAGTKISINAFKELIKDKKTKKVYMFKPSGKKPFEACIILNEEYKTEFYFPPKKNIGICPKCGGNVIKGHNNYFCSNNKEKGCKFTIYRKILGTNISETQVSKLLLNNKSDKLSFTSTQKNKKFDTELILDADKKVVFNFSK